MAIPNQQTPPGNMSEISNAYTQSALPFSLAGNAFQQPFVPQDLWQMPMTLEWDWQDIASGYGETPLSVNGVLNNIPQTMSPDET
jgi:hypothetical protein